MAFDGVLFWIFCLAAIAAMRMAHTGKMRNRVLLALNAVFIASFVTAPLQLLPLAGFLLVGYGAICATAYTRTAGPLTLVAGVVALFIWLKQYTIAAFIPFLGFPYLFVGLSYVLFRVLHLMVDVNQKAVARPGPVAYFSYVGFFLSFVSGPIQRFEDFAEQLEMPPPALTSRSLHLALKRIAIGMFLVAVVTKTFTPHLMVITQAGVNKAAGIGYLRPVNVLEFAAAALVFLLHLYINFVGYMDIVIGVGILCGIQLPENFDKPHLSRNFLDIWSRWHITLSEWFKFYVFNPILRTLAERWPSPRLIPLFGVLGFFVTFALMGIWHGSTPIFLVYGVALGFGVAANKLYQIVALSRLGKSHYKALCQRGWYRDLSRGAAISYFTVGISCVWMRPEFATLLVSLKGVAVVMASFALLTLLFTLMSFAGENLSRIELPAIRVPQPAWLPPVVMAICIFFLMNVILLTDGASEFVYKGF